MFHVEHRFFAILFMFFPFFLFSCTQIDPKPELRDPIYQDMLQQQAATERALVEAQKYMDEQLAAQKEALPQTGKLGLAQKRIFAAQKRIDQINQQKKYWVVRIESRILAARKSYAKSLENKSTWPDPVEYQQYLSEKKLRLAKIEWDAKQRVDDYKKSMKKAPASSAEGAAQPE